MTHLIDLIRTHPIASATIVAAVLIFARGMDWLMRNGSE